MTRWIAAALLIAAATPAAGQTPPPPVEPALAGSADIDLAKTVDWVPFRLTDDGLILVPVRIDGKPARAALNTGAGFSAIDSGFVRDAGMTQRAGPEGFAIAALGSFELGGYRQAGGDLGVRDMIAPLELAPDDRFAMLLANDFLENWIVEIDFDASRIRFLPRSIAKGGAAPVQLHPGPRSRIFMVPIEIGGHRIDRVAFDTGSASGLGISPAAWDSFPHPGTRVTDVQIMTFNGPRLNRYARVDGIRFGNLMVDNVPTEIADISSDPAGPQGRVGVELIKRYNIRFDLKVGGIDLQPRVSPPAPPRVTLAGIQGPLTDQGLAVAHVMRGSPAEAAGLKPGDTVCTIDGERVQASWWGTAKGDWAMGPAGKRVALGLCDGRRIALTLAEFY